MNAFLYSSGMLMNVPPMMMNSTWQATERRYTWQGKLRETYLIHIVTKAFELLYAASCLFVRVIPSPDSSHTSWFVTCVALRTVVEVRVGSSRAVSEGPSAVSLRQKTKTRHTRKYFQSWRCADTGEACTSQLPLRSFTSVSMPHSENFRVTYPARGSDRTRSELRQQSFLVVVRDGTDDIY